jgi:hypothetical protein
MNTCPECKGTKKIVLFTSVVPCDLCTRAKPAPSEIVDLEHRDGMFEFIHKGVLIHSIVDFIGTVVSTSPVPVGCTSHVVHELQACLPVCYRFTLFTELEIGREYRFTLKETSPDVFHVQHWPVVP